FTFILPAATSRPKVFKGRKEVGIRVPDNTISRAIAERLGHPILSSSLKVDDEVPVFDAHELATAFEGVASLLIDDGGSNADGGFDVQPSTVVDLTDSSSPEILREGRGELQ
ncbi:MAG: Sua5/YciO/YrdC/YwlC family protein, partial [Duncaniella sp.]|nr:Sua5/YciO/YrdC/YwlC family protein [Duncaniella sp.]